MVVLRAKEILHDVDFLLTAHEGIESRLEALAKGAAKRARVAMVYFIFLNILFFVWLWRSLVYPWFGLEYYKQCSSSKYGL